MKIVKKRLLALLLCFSMCASLAACGTPKDAPLSFDSKAEMLQHLEGVWCERTTYYVITNDEMRILSNDGDTATQAVKEAVRRNPDIHNKLDSVEGRELIMSAFNDLFRTSAYAYPISDVDFATGEFSCNGSQWVVRKDGLFYESKDRVLSKVADTTDVEFDWVDVEVYEATKDFKLKPDTFALRADDYYYKLEEEILTTPYKALPSYDGMRYYSLDGKDPKDSVAWIAYSGSKLLWSDLQRNTDFLLTYLKKSEKNESNLLYLKATLSENTTYMIKTALMCLDGYPLELSPNDILQRIKNNCVTGSGGEIVWAETVGEVLYSYMVDPSDGSQVFSLSW